jgi:hypothetical protein
MKLKAQEAGRRALTLMSCGGTVLNIPHANLPIRMNHARNSAIELRDKFLAFCTGQVKLLPSVDAF